MERSMNTVHVALEDRSYDIHIANGLLGRAGQLLACTLKATNTAVITNATIASLYLETLRTSLRSAGCNVFEVILPDGEQFKTLDSISLIYEHLLGFGLDRSSALIALGGGVVGDMTGFAAATFMRGIPFVQVPTTLLAQVDSSVGGKTGVNLTGGKNMVGAFYQPRCVLIDPMTLHTLPERELRAGFAEVIKYGIINDPDFFAWLESSLEAVMRLDADALVQVIMRCCTIKADIASKDEREQGVRAYLNYGHTLGHAIETLTGYASFLHGEAVAIGMCAAARLALRLGLCPEADVRRIEALVQAAGLPVAAPAFPAGDYLAAMLKDKKKTGSTINFVLPHRIGEVALHPVSQDRLRAFLTADLAMR